MRSCDISVVIPLYNKEREILQSITSVLNQRVLPQEIIVVDDGSTDSSAEIVQGVNHPLIRLIRQQNMGVSAARNRGLKEAKGRYVALLDGDDRWREGYLEEILTLMDRWQGCGAYSTAFDIESEDSLTPASTPDSYGIVDFFRESMRRYVLIPSSTTLDRELALKLGGFPVGMRMGEDQYLWTLIARNSQISFSPKREVIYSRSASNRSASIWRKESCSTSLEELYDTSASEISNEYVARVALGKALIVSSRGDTLSASTTLQHFKWSRMNRFAWWKLKILNSMPKGWRASILSLYNRLAWAIARRGM